MSSILSSQGVVVATAMAVSGAVILLALRLQKSIPAIQFPVSQIPKSSKRVIRSCISSGMFKNIQEIEITSIYSKLFKN